MGKRNWGDRKIPDGTMQVRSETNKGIRTITVLIKKNPPQTNIRLSLSEAGELLSAFELIAPGRIRGMAAEIAIEYIHEKILGAI